MIRLSISVALAAGVVSSHAALAQTARFEPLGGLSGAPLYSIGFRGTNNGRAVVGIAQDTTGPVAFRWTSVDSMVSLGRLTADGASQAFALSGDGRVVVGSVDVPGGTEAFRWTAAGGMIALDNLGGPHWSAAYACSADGSIVVGSANIDIGVTEEIGRARAFRWSNATGMVGLNYLRPSDTFSDAEAITPDGSVLVGGSGLEGVRLEATRWLAGTPSGLGDLPGGRTWSLAYGVNSNGSIIVGQGESANGPEAFRWTSAGMVGIGDLPGGPFDSAAVGTTDDGSIIVGFGATSSQPREAFMWTAAAGMRRLIDVLQIDHHLDLTGWVLREASWISPDGRFIVGNGYNPSGDREAWLVDLRTPTACTADFNHDGVVNSQDFFDFLTAFFACP